MPAYGRAGAERIGGVRQSMERTEQGKGAKLATLLLTIGVAFWGLSFLFVKASVTADVDVFSFLFVRFSIATALLCVVFFRKLRHFDAKVVKRGIVTGLCLGIPFIMQTTGLKYTTPSKSAFITGLCVIIVPVMVALIDRRIPRPYQIIAVLMGFAGLVMLTFKLPFVINRGDVWTLMCAVGFAGHLVLVGRLTHGIDAVLFTIVQLAVTASIALIGGLAVNGGIVFSSSREVWEGVLFCAVFASAYIYTVQAYFQKFISELKTAMIFAFEPLFAAVFSAIFLGERLGVMALSGGVLMFAGMVLSEAGGAFGKTSSASVQDKNTL